MAYDVYIGETMSLIDAQIYGNEPSWDRQFADDHERYCALSRAFNWYNYMAKPEDRKIWLIDYMKTQNYEKSQIDRIRRLSGEEVKLEYGDMPGCVGFDAGTIARLKTLGAPLVDSDVEMLGKVIEFLINKPEPVKKETGIRPNVQKAMDEQLCRILGQLEAEYDNALCGVKTAVAVVLGESKNVYAKKIADFYDNRLKELSAILDGTDPEITEAYAIYGKKNLKNAKTTVEEILKICGQKIDEKASTKIVRRKRRKPPIEIVKKLQYKKEDKDFGLVSVLASKIVGVQKLVVFNTKYRTVTLFEAVGPDGLSVKGTTIINFDAKKSRTKKLRKPLDFFKSIQGKGIRATRAAFDSVKSVEKEAKGRINEDVILYGVFE